MSKLLRYTDYLTENKIYELILESKVVYSKKFINLLNKMKSNKIAKNLLDIYSKDLDITQNYIDLTDEKDSVSFTPDRKVKEIIGSRPQLFKVIESGKYLTHSDRNNKIFEALGYNKEGRENWAPDIQTIGKILNETVSALSGKVYVLFEEYTESNPRLAVLNKEAVEELEPEDQRLWSTSRSKIKIGRFVRALLRASNITFTDSELEQFTNLYKATYDFAADALKMFDIVKGSKIAYWYSEERYVRGGGTLNNSCMADVDSDYFNIYTENSAVSLVILYGDNGTITGDKYTATEIKGRALLWDCSVNGQTAKFMDRVYTTHDSDVELFKQFAEKNGWWFKKNQSMEPQERLTNGVDIISAKIEVSLDEFDFEYYPYFDTLCYLNEEDELLSNHETGHGKVMRDTGGGYDSY